MLIDRTHRPWLLASVLLLASAAAAYWGIAKHSLHGPTGGSVLGLIYGIVGSLLMIFAALLAVRKKLPTWRVGSAQFWLRGHLWMGTVGFVLVLFHAGFGWGGLLENLLWVSFGLVVLTGFLGVALQQVMPRLLTTRVPLETMVAQIPFLSKTMLFRADQLVAKQVGVLDVDYEPLKPFAEAALKQQRVLKRESDFPKELAKVYANVPLPEADAKKPPAHVAEPVVAAKPAEGLDTKPPSTSVSPTTTDATATTARLKSPIELMREKAAAKAASTEQLSSVGADQKPAPAAAPEKKLSPIEQMRAKAATAQAAKTNEAPDPIAAEAVPAGEEKKLSPIEQMRVKMATKPAETPSSAAAPAVQAVVKTEKKLSPLEQMKAKLAEAKGSAAEGSLDAHRPLTVEKPTVAQEPSTASVGSDAVKKPSSITKPSMEKPVAAAPAKPAAKAPAPIPPAVLAELRDFHVRVVRSFLSNGRSLQYRLDDGISARRVFSQLRSDLPAELHDSLRELEELCEERRQFNTQLRLHRWLHWWLILHIPPSIALLVLFVAHVVVSLRVVPF